MYIYAIYLVLLLQTWSHLGECPLKILAFLKFENKKEHTELFYSQKNVVMPMEPQVFCLVNNLLLPKAIVVRNTAD